MKKLNQRIDVAPEGGLPAMIGFYSTRIQRVVKKWESIKPDVAENYFLKVASPIRFRENNISIFVSEQSHWQFIGELMAAAADLYSDKESPEYWILTLPIGVALNGKFPGHPAIAEWITKSGGKKFSRHQIQKAYDRLRLETPTELAHDWLRSRPS